MAQWLKVGVKREEMEVPGFCGKITGYLKTGGVTSCDSL